MKKKPNEPDKLNAVPVRELTYTIRNNKKPDGLETVQAFDTAYGRVGIRMEREGKVKRTVLDHIATGWRIADFPSDYAARAALSEMLGVTDFKWIRPPKAIGPQMRDIITRYKQFS